MAHSEDFRILIYRFMVLFVSRDTFGQCIKIFVAAASFIIASSISAQPVIQTDFLFYDIYPDSKDDIWPEMHDKTLVENSRRTGHTHWHVRWTYKWKKKDNDCEIKQVNTFLTVTYTLPRIPDDHVVHADVRDSFDRYYEALFKHEEEHKNSGLYAALEIEDAIINLGSFRKCRDLDAAAEKTGNSIIKKFNKRDEDYDRETDHGRTEGARIDNFI
jgi:predicted secreted Zn-dependent protease